MNKLTWLFVFCFLLGGPIAGTAEPENEKNPPVTLEKTLTAEGNKTEVELPATGTNSPAEDKVTKASSAELSTGSLSFDLFWSGIKSAGALICVLAVIFAGTYLLKKTMPSRFGALGNQKMMQIMESVTLGDKRFLHLVKIRGSYILIGSTPAQVALIETFPEMEEAELRVPDMNNQVLPAQNLPLEKKPRALFSLFKSSPSRTRQNKNSGISFNEIMQRTVKGDTHPAGVKDKSYLNRLAAIRESLEAQ